jgi:glyoxylase-like metal-dependent hydrolase (beta-lactamase superfamily II)
MKDILLRKLVVGELATNCYVVGCATTGEGMVIDPGGDPDAILYAVEDMELTIQTILNTHGHIDHMLANSEIKHATGAELLIHEYDASMLVDPSANLSSFAASSVVSPPADRLLKEGEKVKVGGMLFEVIHTPGHTSGGISLVREALVFSGDTLFAGSIGRTDFPGGSLELLLHSIRTKLLPLPLTTTVLPGHGPNTTIGDERKCNPFL